MGGSLMERDMRIESGRQLHHIHISICLLARNIRTSTLTWLVIPDIEFTIGTTGTLPSTMVNQECGHHLTCHFAEQFVRTSALWLGPSGFAILIANGIKGSLQHWHAGE